MITNTVKICTIGLQDYLTCWKAMQAFTHERNEETADEFWLVEHPPVFTQGQSGKPEHLLQTGSIPVIQIDRGGQVTYHGPGQLVVYTLIDMKRKKFTIRDLVTHLEKSVIALIADYSVEALAKRDAPGVYIQDKKICSIGLRIRRGCSYHGLALNVAMDLEPFSRINPCGFPRLKMTQLSELDKNITVETAGLKLVKHLMANLGYNNALNKNQS